MSWSLKGSYFETCSCELMCPCNMSMDHGATYDYCRVVLVFNLKEGEIEGTDVAGLAVAVVADTPKVMTEGNWRLGMFVDDAASDEQMEKLAGDIGAERAQVAVVGRPPDDDQRVAVPELRAQPRVVEPPDQQLALVADVLHRVGGERGQGLVDAL